MPEQLNVVYCTLCPFAARGTEDLEFLKQKVTNHQDQVHGPYRNKNVRYQNVVLW